MIGWNSEAFARTKQMKPLAEYLKPALTPEEKRNQGARKVKALFESVQRRQEATDGPG